MHHALEVLHCMRSALDDAVGLLLIVVEDLLLQRTERCIRVQC